MGAVEFIEPERGRLWLIGWDTARSTWAASYQPWPLEDGTSPRVNVRGHAAGDQVPDAAALLDWFVDQARVAIPSEVTDLLTRSDARESAEVYQLWSIDMIGADPWNVGTESQRWDGYLDLSRYDPATNSHLLANKVGARDYDQLREREDQFVGARLALMREATRIPTTFDLDGLRQIHAYLFQDVYSWAGELRSVNIGKGSGSFSPPDRIASDLALVSDYLRSLDDLRDLPADQLPAKLAATYNAVNAVHPFREGNGRTQRALISALALHNGHQIDWTTIDEDRNTAACESGRRGDLEPLETIFVEIVTPLGPAPITDAASLEVRRALPNLAAAALLLEQARQEPYDVGEASQPAPYGIDREGTDDVERSR